MAPRLLTFLMGVFKQMRAVAKNYLWATLPFGVCLLLVVLFLARFSLPAQRAGANVPAKPITVVLRFDDTSSRSMSALETKLFEILQRHHARATIAVIPFVGAESIHLPEPQDLVPLTPEKAVLLRQAMAAGTIEVALHGFSHLTQRNRGNRGPSEFAGLPLEVQADRIQKGKQFLEGLLGTPISVFIPPWNSYDLNTLRAAERAGIRIFSATAAGDGLAGSHLDFLPITGHLADLRASISAARECPDPLPVVALLLHGYDFREEDAQRGRFTTHDFEELLAWLTSQSDVVIRTESEAVAAGDRFDAARFLSNQKLSRVCGELAPPFICSKAKFGNDLVYASSDYARRMGEIYRVLVDSFYLLFCVFIALVARGFHAVLVGHPRLRRLATYAAFVLLVLAATWAWRDGRIYYRGLLAVLTLAGAWLGLCSGSIATWFLPYLSRSRRPVPGLPSGADRAAAGQSL